MIKSDSKVQFEGAAPKYSVPDTRAMLYRIHGQVDYSLNKKPKTTYITEIFDN